jgi:hypothetical protein
MNRPAATDEGLTEYQRGYIDGLVLKAPRPHRAAGWGDPLPRAICRAECGGWGFDREFHGEFRDDHRKKAAAIRAALLGASDDEYAADTATPETEK